MREIIKLVIGLILIIALSAALAIRYPSEPNCIPVMKYKSPYLDLCK